MILESDIIDGRYQNKVYRLPRLFFSPGPRSAQSATQPFLVSSRNERCVTTLKTAVWQTTLGSPFSFARRFSFWPCSTWEPVRRLLQAALWPERKHVSSLS